VVGGTAVVGEGCSFLHGVTLGGTGKDGTGNRHPRLGDHVLVGCNATLLGLVSVGNNAKIGSGSMVLKDVGDGVTVVGNPARPVGVTIGKDSGGMMDTALCQVRTPSGRIYTPDVAMVASMELSSQLPLPIGKSRSTAFLAGL
jgi:serine acetyltransferase